MTAPAVPSSPEVPSAPLLAALAGGRSIGWETFVAVALDDPDHGFYGQGGRAGRRGDFLTSPEVGPLFGAVLARALDRWWAEAGHPDPWTLVDWGAGPGTLVRSVLAADPVCARALRVVLVEKSARQRAGHGAHMAVLGPLEAATCPAWSTPGAGPLVASVASDPPLVGPAVIVANELLDNLPFGLLEMTDDGWAEVRLILDEGSRLVEELGARVDPPAAVASAAVGARVPVQAAARRWLAGARRSVGEGGRVVVFDYTATTSGLAGREWREWVRTFAGHGRGDHPLCRVGHQDVTVEVCVDQLAAEAVPVSLRTQAEALAAWGMGELVEEGRRTWAQRASIGDLAAIRARSRVREAEALTDLGGLGAFTVMEWRGPGSGS